MVDQRPRRFRGNCNYDFNHRDREIQQNDEDALNERTALASRAFVYTKCKNGQSGAIPGLPIFLVGGVSPNPPGTLEVSNGCAFLRNAFVVTNGFCLDLLFASPHLFRYQGCDPHWP